MNMIAQQADIILIWFKIANTEKDFFHKIGCANVYIQFIFTR